MYKVKEVSHMTGVSIRTLHHYDHIGLLIPDGQSDAGYRLYSDENIEQLQQILFFKEMGFHLAEIKDMIHHPDFDRTTALKAHKQILLKKKERLEQMIQTVNTTLTHLTGGIQMEKKDMFNGFDQTEIEAYQKQYAEEAKEKYGTKIVEETEKRTKSYSNQDWSNIQGEMDHLFQQISVRMDLGPDSEEVQNLIGKYRQYITKNFYDCTLDIFRGLGDLYVTDERFTANIDRHQAGLSEFLRQAMHIYCDREMQK
ncbi:DNA-binding transcriptional MerR regulator [Bacillus ectoiniformans]|uniref:MerR family transcriptional regulator n=1 Tax=Bacillus ectoiniformans TaxID=1494429 RepID=UPI00195C5A36|nr:MerR family transcriptional regulator [Bacillus ectoiniformans]MBM7649453.1 DNA-binding transcriptional MerR regulator [Bacillus ectoiniformans]